MKKLLLTTICAICVLGMAATASAEPVQWSGTWFEWGRLYDDVTGSISGTPGLPLTVNPYPNVAPPNLNNPTQTLTPGVYDPSVYGALPSVPGPADTTEDSWGAVDITLIKSATKVIYQASAADEITAFFYGGNDKMITMSTPNFVDGTLLTDGFIAEFYYDPNNDFYNAGIGAFGDITDRTGVSSFNGATEGQLLLRLEGHNQYLDWVVGDANEATRTQPYELAATGNITGAGTGAINGDIFLDVTGGAWAYYYDTNTFDMQGDYDLDGVQDVFGYKFADFRLTTTVFPTLGTPVLFNVEGVGTAQADLIPEPATMLLLGTGLVGIAGSARRRRKKNQA